MSVRRNVRRRSVRLPYDKVQKIGLCKLYKLNKTFKKWVHHLMSLPFLPEEDIRPTYLASHMH